MLTGQPHVIKEYNADLVKNLIAEKGPLTKPMIAEATQLSLPTVNKIVAELERAGVIREGEFSRDIAAGRPAKAYVLNEHAGSILAVCCLDGHFVAALYDFTGREIGRRILGRELPADGEPLQLICRAVREFSSQYRNIKAVGIGIPGVVKSNGMVAGIPRIPSFDGVRLAQEVGERCGLPVFVENDVKLMTVGLYGEQLERQCRDMVLLYIGRGLGSGIILNKRLHKGLSCFAGEFGYMSISGEQPSKNGEAALERRMTALLDSFAAGEAGEKQKREYCGLAARVAANFVTVLNPEVIAFRAESLGGGALALIRAEMEKLIPADDMPRLILVDSDEYELLGAFRLCLSSISTKMKLVQQQGV